MSLDRRRRRKFGVEAFWFQLTVYATISRPGNCQIWQEGWPLGVAEKIRRGVLKSHCDWQLRFSQSMLEGEVPSHVLQDFSLRRPWLPVCVVPITCLYNQVFLFGCEGNLPIAQSFIAFVGRVAQAVLAA